MLVIMTVCVIHTVCLVFLLDVW